MITQENVMKYVVEAKGSVQGRMIESGRSPVVKRNY